MTDDALDRSYDLGDDEPGDINTFDLQPVGWYKAKAVVADPQRSKQKLTPSIHIHWGLREPSEFNGKIIFDDLWLTKLHEDGFNKRRLKNALKAVGAPWTGGQTPLQMAKAIENGSMCYIFVDIDFDKTGEYADKNRVMGYRSLDNPPDDTIGPRDIQPTPPVRTMKGAHTAEPPTVEEDILLDD